MSFTETDEHRELRASLRRFLAEKSTSAAVRGLMEDPTGNDPAVWAQMADQLGLQSLPIPEEYGGSGYGPEELSIALEEMGRVLLVSPYFATVALAAQTLVASGDAEAMARYLPGMADGSVTATVAAGEGNDSWFVGETSTTAFLEGDRWALTGTKTLVIDGATADLLLAFAVADRELGLFVVQRAATGVTTTPLDTIDLTRKLAKIEFNRAPAVRVGGDAGELVKRARDLAIVALAAEQLGGAQRCLDMSVAYAKLRVAFGRTIGSFQAIKHKCANVLIEVETARSAVLYAATAVRDPGIESATAAALAQASSAEAYVRAARENIQIHGGIGFTWEHDAHLYLKRATADALLFGAPVAHRARLGVLAGVT